MQSVTPDGSSARGFAGLASLGIPIDDLLSDIPTPSNGVSATELPPLTVGQPAAFSRTSDSKRWPSVGMLFAALMSLIAVAVAAFWFWRADGIDQLDSPSQPTPQAVDSSVLVQPPFGRESVLTRAQIRYCLAEEIRLQAARDQTATQRIDVERLNASVADLNARCGSFQYQGSDLALAQADIAQQTSGLIAAGRADFLLADESTPGDNATRASESQAPARSVEGGQQAGDTAAPSASATVAADPAQQKLVRDVQWLLFKLGYYNGVMSGVDTEATRSAREAYLTERNRDPATPLDETLSLLKADTEEPAPATREEADTSVKRETPSAQDEPVVTEEDVPASDPAPAPLVTPDMSGLADADRLAIEQLCRATSSGEGYVDCLNQQLSDLRAVDTVSLTQLSDSERQAALADCGPVRGRDGPAAYYLCLADFARAPVQNVVAAEPTQTVQQLPENVVSAIESRCAAQLTAENGEHARCVSGQFANLSDALNPVFINDIEFPERASIEAVCASGSSVGDVSVFYNCVRDEMDDLRSVGAKPDMKVAGFEARKDIETACQQDRLARGPADYYRCLSRELAARGY